jgi:hypothetical protein
MAVFVCIRDFRRCLQGYVLFCGHDDRILVASITELRYFACAFWERTMNHDGWQSKLLPFPLFFLVFSAFYPI